ncbi:hypothetical protein AAT19DRAFT_12164 [Rhodotorula toruloides]|uniref:Uncharacterized protein n=1 Tax=Rhodotorula toruloides TaxID=5286 RepID=A0A2T0AFF0_RHOTO|nr:hypothetical protein AAT19DRAFT_12164 [Rhodotorula toruloides]
MMLNALRSASRTLSRTVQIAGARSPLAAPSHSRLISTSSSALSPILSTAASRLTSAAARPQTSLLQRELAQAGTRPGFWHTSPSPLSSAVQQQVRGYKMPKCMRRKASPLARNGGKGKTARRKGMLKVCSLSSVALEDVALTLSSRNARPSGEGCVSRRSTRAADHPRLVAEA